MAQQKGSGQKASNERNQASQGGKRGSTQGGRSGGEAQSGNEPLKGQTSKVSSGSDSSQKNRQSGGSKT
jgi:hypothetical protein